MKHLHNRLAKVNSALACSRVRNIKDEMKRRTLRISAWEKVIEKLCVYTWLSFNALHRSDNSVVRNERSRRGRGIVEKRMLKIEGKWGTRSSETRSSQFTRPGFKLTPKFNTKITKLPSPGSGASESFTEVVGRKAKKESEALIASTSGIYIGYRSHRQINS